jgi:hypothetical protein
VKLSELPDDFQLRSKKTNDDACDGPDACKHRDAERLFDLAHATTNPTSGVHAVRAVAHALSEVAAEIQKASLQVWIETKMLAHRVDNRICA